MLLVQVGDHVSGLTPFMGPKDTHGTQGHSWDPRTLMGPKDRSSGADKAASPQGDAARAFWEMKLLARRKVPFHLYLRARDELECAHAHTHATWCPVPYTPELPSDVGGVLTFARRLTWAGL